jgi:hypothetical protein
MAATGLADASPPIPPRATEPPTDPGVHPVIYGFHRAFRGGLPAPPDGLRTDEVGRFDAISRADTARGARTRLAFLAADRAVRLFLPMAIDATGLHAQAVPLRALPAVTDAASARVASAACLALHTRLSGTPEVNPRRQPWGTLLATVLVAGSAAGASAASASPSPTAERDAADAGFQAGRVTYNAVWLLRSRRDDSPRAAVVAAAIATLQDLVSAARRP